MYRVLKFKYKWQQKIKNKKEIKVEKLYLKI